MSNDALPEIQTFWYGNSLSRIERLALSSFVANGHPVNLYLYEELQGVPAGVRVRDAEEILPRSSIFFHRRTGSVAAYADWFRYRLLHAKGGIWVDLDVVCLRPLDYKRPEVFGWEDQGAINNAVLGLPAGHRLSDWMAQGCEHPNRSLPYDTLKLRLRKLRRRLLQGDRRDRVRWGEYGPKGLTSAIRYFGYESLALSPVQFYPIHFTEWQKVFEPGLYRSLAAFAESRAIHLNNNKLRRWPGFDKNRTFAPDSLFEMLCERYLTDHA